MTEFPCKQNRPELWAPASSAKSVRSLYVHVPFCRRKCAYCDFASHVARPGQVDRYTRALQAELDLRQGELAGRFETCYFGGGTPTALTVDVLGGLLKPLVGRLVEGGELSIESNPATVTRELAEMLRDVGVNRVTLGAQSFVAAELETLGRLHGPEDVDRAAGLLRAAGLANLAVDLIYAIPGQSRASWQASLERALAIAPEHVSCYALSIEPSTPLYARWQGGEFTETHEETQRAMYDQAVETLTAAGYEHYELSNFARPGRASRHNLVYWRNGAYLGVGPGACSYVAGQRRQNPRDFDAWLTPLEARPPALPPTQDETLPAREALGEALMLGLRLTAGVDEAAVASRYGQTPSEAFPHSIARQIELGTLRREDGRLRLDREAYFTSDAVLAEILHEAKEN